MIKGERVVIRPMEPDDLDYLMKWRNSAEAMNYSEHLYGFLFSRDNMMRMVENQFREDGFFPRNKTFMIETTEGEVIGDVGYRNWDPRNRSAELGIEIGEPDFRGKGLGCELASLFSEYMFRHLNINRIELSVLRENPRAIRVYEKTGFKPCGYRRQAVFNSRENRYSDILVMDFLRSEWEAGLAQE